YDTHANFGNSTAGYPAIRDGRPAVYSPPTRCGIAGGETWHGRSADAARAGRVVTMGCLELYTAGPTVPATLRRSCHRTQAHRATHWGMRLRAVLERLRAVTGLLTCPASIPSLARYP